MINMKKLSISAANRPATNTKKKRKIATVLDLIGVIGVSPFALIQKSGVQMLCCINRMHYFFISPIYIHFVNKIMCRQIVV